jgi:hypothetical protein
MAAGEGSKGDSTVSDCGVRPLQGFLERSTVSALRLRVVVALDFLRRSAVPNNLTFAEAI